MSAIPRNLPGNFPPAPGVAAMASVSGCVVHPPLRIGDGSLSVMKIMFHLPRHTRPSMADRTNTGHGGACYNDTLRPWTDSGFAGVQVQPSCTPGEQVV